MEKRGRGRPPKVSLPLSNQHPDFFDVFLPDLASHQLQIPPDFIKHFERKIPEKVVVKDLQEKVWHVDLKQEKNCVFLTNGWNAFVKDKCLKPGEFMVFRYNKKSAAFTVRIFGLDMCKKDDEIGHLFGYVKEEQESDQKSTPVCKHEHPNDTPQMPEIVADSKEATLGRTLRSGSKIESAPLRRTLRSGSTRVKQNKGFKAQTQTICFIVDVSKSKRFQMPISKRVLNAYNVHFGPNEEMSLYNKKGKSYPVKISRTSDHRIVISSGWSNFRVENNIELDDRVKFTLVLGHGRVCTKMYAKSIKSEC